MWSGEDAEGGPQHRLWPDLAHGAGYQRQRYSGIPRVKAFSLVRISCGVTYTQTNTRTNTRTMIPRVKAFTPLRGRERSPVPRALRGGLGGRGDCDWSVGEWVRYIPTGGPRLVTFGGDEAHERAQALVGNERASQCDVAQPPAPAQLPHAPATAGS
eukprot:1185761-Prorocentrum_minimum.AAC.1